MSPVIDGIAIQDPGVRANATQYECPSASDHGHPEVATRANTSGVIITHAAPQGRTTPPGIQRKGYATAFWRRMTMMTMIALHHLLPWMEQLEVLKVTKQNFIPRTPHPSQISLLKYHYRRARRTLPAITYPRANQRVFEVDIPLRFSSICSESRR